MTTTVTAKIQLRKGTAAAWTSANPVLLSGEVGFETDTLKLKIGDGTTAWISLAYHHDPDLAATYAAIAHTHSGVYEPADATLLKQADVDDTPVNGVTTAPVSSNWAYDHAALSTAHGISSFGATLVDDADAATARGTLGLGTAAVAATGDFATASHDHAATYAPLAKGVTNGDSHDHSGGDGGQIAYSTLSGLPTLGTAAATASTAYATAAQGSTADTALQPGDDAADLGSGSATDGYVLTADGAGGAAWEATAVTYAGAASEIHAATEKTTPVDADELGLVDSAASWVLKRLTWANLKTTLSGVFALLAGKSGGQTLIGGTGVTDKLVLQGTSGNGTSTATALQVNVGNNGNLAALTIANNGQLTIQGDATTDLPVYGSELLTSAGWTVNAGWTESPDDTFAHSSGVGTLTHSAGIGSGNTYKVSLTITGRTVGSVTITVGGQSFASISATGTFWPTTISTAAFTITPTTDFNGTLSLVSLKRMTDVSTTQRVVKDSTGTVVLEERSNLTSVFLGIQAGGFNISSYNTAIGHSALSKNTTGYSNTAIGHSALSKNTTGIYNIAIGAGALANETTASANTGVGYACLTALTTGNYNVCLGRESGYSITTGASNVVVGHLSFNGVTTGSFNCCLGSNAGRYQSDGTTALTDPEYSIYIGYNARGKDNSDNNSVVIGGNTPIGLGANTTVIGTSATTLTRLFGNIATGVDSPSAAIHAIKTTEQLRLGYDASYYASFTVSSTGNLTLDTTGGTIYTPDVIENTVNGEGIILKSPDGTRYKITVANGGTLSIAAA